MPARPGWARSAVPPASGRDQGWWREQRGEKTSGPRHHTWHLYAAACGHGGQRAGAVCGQSTLCKLHHGASEEHRYDLALAIDLARRVNGNNNMTMSLCVAVQVDLRWGEVYAFAAPRTSRGPQSAGLALAVRLRARSLAISAHGVELCAAGSTTQR